MVDGAAIGGTIEYHSTASEWQRDLVQEEGDSQVGQPHDAWSESFEELQFKHPLHYAMMLWYHMALTDLGPLIMKHSYEADRLAATRAAMLRAAAREADWLTAALVIRDLGTTPAPPADVVAAIVASRGCWENTVRVVCQPCALPTAQRTLLWYEALLALSGGRSKLTQRPAGSWVFALRMLQMNVEGLNTESPTSSCSVDTALQRGDHHQGGDDPFIVLALSLATRLAKCFDVKAHQSVYVLLRATGRFGAITSPDLTHAPTQHLVYATRAVVQRVVRQQSAWLAKALLESPLPLVCADTLVPLLTVLKHRDPPAYRACLARLHRSE